MASPRGSCCFRPTLSGLVLLCAMAMAAADAPTPSRATSIRMGPGGTIVAVHPRSSAPHATAGATPSYPFPRPRLTGFSPLIAVTTSDKRRSPFDDLLYEHELESSFAGTPLNGPADVNFVVGVLDSGADVDLAAGSAADTLGLFGSRLTSNLIPIVGVGDPVDTLVTYPIGIFAAGLSAVDQNGRLDLNSVVGHSNVAALVAPPIDCGNGEAVTAFVGMPFLAFYNSVIRVDTPRKITVDGEVHRSPDVRIQDPFDPLPAFPRSLSMAFGPQGGATTASFFPDFEDLETPFFPTLLSLGSGALSTGGAFFADIFLREGESSPDNPAQQKRLLVDTGAQSSIISPGVAADLSLPREPDFTVTVCGVGGLVEGVPGYYVDFVKMNASGGALQFSRAPFIVLDLPSPEGGPLDGILGMNFFWNRNVAFEPFLTGSSFFDVSDPIPVAFGDSDVDFHVDAADASFFFTCMTGPASTGVSPECDHLDVDFDGSIDLGDLAKFQNCFSGPDRLADPTCAD
jgi:hypothetical protein